MQKIKYLILSLLLSKNIYASESNFIFIGGGGEPEGETTIFDKNIEGLKEYYQSQNFTNTTISFNGGHKKTEEIISNTFNKNNPKFTNTEMEDIVKNYLSKIEKNEIKSGDQILLYIDSHGAMKTDSKYRPEFTHQIATSGRGLKNLNTLEGSSVISLDILTSLVKKAEEKNIKLGIIDMSCHSGNSIPLASLGSKNTCVISASGPNHYGFAGTETFSGQFVKNMKKGKSLEEVFLDARKDATDVSYPMISTSAGQKVADEIYHLITPYLYYQYDNSDKLDGYISEGLKQSTYQCQRDNQFSDLQKILNEVEKLNTVVKKVLFWNVTEKKFDLESFKQALSKYKKEQDEIIEIEKELNKEKYNLPLIADRSFTFADLIDGVTIRELLSSDYAAAINVLKNKLSKESDNDNKMIIKEEIEQMSEMAKFREKIAKENPTVLDLIKRQDQLKKATYYTAYEVKMEEKKFFDKYYQMKKEKESTSLNPCKEFIL